MLEIGVVCDNSTCAAIDVKINASPKTERSIVHTIFK